MKLWLSTNDLAERWGVDPSTIRKYAKKYGGVRDFGEWRFYLPIIEKIEKSAIQKAKMQVESSGVA